METTMYNKKLADSFIISKGVKKVKCFNEDKPIKIMGDVEEEDGKVSMRVYSGEARWDGEKWEYHSDYSMLCKVIMKN